MRNFLILLLLLTSLLRADDEYQLGEGIQVGALPFYVGGYFSLDYRSMDNEKRYRVDDIAVMGYGGYEKFSYMAEFEYKEFYVKTNEDGSSDTQTNSQLYTERLYIDYNLDENYMFRAGKYNSPVGFWNLLPINVLRETTSSPVSTLIIFPKFTTGLAASYSSFGNGELKVDVMLQHNDDIDAQYNNYEIDRHYGFGLTYEENKLSLKINAGHFHEIDKKVLVDEHLYILASAKYETDKFQILTELGRQRSKDDITTKHAGYIQGLYRFTEKHLGILRVESYDDRVSEQDEEFAVFGYTYRPLYPIAIKSEYQLHSKSELNQVLLSVSVLF